MCKLASTCTRQVVETKCHLTAIGSGTAKGRLLLVGGDNAATLPKHFYSAKGLAKQMCMVLVCLLEILVPQELSIITSFLLTLYIYRHPSRHRYYLLAIISMI